ncbi:MFS transporter [Sphingosinicella soli]|uniref:MFS family permease n=1 Tax=Sphingosinicella soli TaxID=333708 RepID=A0A7W7F7N9_9SPHN|nr:MFS transporter [Sphingosinicella soli]MBB4632884.1 MFS family permease [Sphingosinicella soli]
MIIAGIIGSFSLALIAIGVMTTLVPMHGVGIGFSPLDIGWIAGLYYLGFLVGPWIAPPLVQRLGSGRAFAVAALLALGGIIVLPLFPDAAAWAGIRFVSGTGFAVLYILAEAGLNAEVSNAGRGRMLSIYMIVSKAALMLGQLVVGTLGVEGWAPFVAASGVVALAAVLRMQIPTGKVLMSAGRLRPLRVLRAAPVAMTGCAIYGLGEASLYALGPLYAQSNGMGVAEVSMFMTATLLGAAVAQWPLGWLSDRMDRRRAILLGVVCTMIAVCALGLTARPGFAVALAGGFVLGGSLLPLYGLLVALGNDSATNEERVEMGSGLVFAYAVGAIVGPPAAAVLMELTPRGLPLWLAALSAVQIVILLVAMRRPAPLTQPL